ncbi:hypothetical protein M885DRAFT_22660 [Pelagophyceae sp. CCMP2097]|nr:hypothetical protein M885DRAFT_22660 [Pelagophyceae sp. CCMP2097]
MKVELIEPVAVKKFDELYTFFGRAALDNKPVLFAIGSETAAPDWLNKLHGKLTEDLLKEAKADDPEAPAKALLKEARAATKNSAAKEAIDEAMKALEQSGSKAKPLFSAAYASDGETAAAFNATLKPGDVHVFVAALDRKALGLSVVAAFGANPVVAQKRGKVDLAALKAFVESVAAAAKAGPAQLKGVSDVATLPELPKPNSVLAAEARAAKKKASAGEVSPVASAADLASKCYDLSSAKTCAVILTDGPVSAGDFSDVAAKYAANGFAFVHVDAATAPAALFAALRGPNEALPALVVVKGGKRARAARAHGADAFAAMLEAVIGGEGKFDKFAGGLPAWPAAAAEGAAAGADGDEYDL